MQRLKRGFSFIETQRQFSKEFNCTIETARAWVNQACDQIAEQDNNATRRRAYVTVIEMYHDQIVSYQNELLGIQNEIKALTDSATVRNQILEEMKSANLLQRRELARQLESLPQVGPTTIAGLIEAKSRIRDRMYKVMQDIARLRGFTGISDWRQALNTLLDNGLLPPTVADGILSLIDDFEGSVRSFEVEPTIVDPEDLEIPEPTIPEPA